MFHEKNFPLSSKKFLTFHLNIKLDHKTGLKTLGGTKINKGRWRKFMNTQEIHLKSYMSLVSIKDNTGGLDYF